MADSTGVAGSTSEDLATRFARTLAELRADRQLNRKDLAHRMGFDPSYVSHIETGRFRPTAEFVWRAEDALQADGELLRAFEEYWQAGHGNDRPPPVRPVVAPGTELIVRSEEAAIVLDDEGFYRVTLVRRVHNVGAQPLTHFPTRIEVDAYPGEPERSSSFYTDNPVTFAETGFWAEFNGEPTGWVLLRDRPAYKKIHILFQPAGAPDPLYPGESATVACGYRLHRSKFGAWFGREVRWPTERLSISLAFPSRLGIDVHGEEITWSQDQALRPIGRPESPSIYTWATETPTLNSFYRFAWRLPAMA